MILAVPKESKNREYRVAMTPTGVALLVKHGHHVVVQKGAGFGSGFSDILYRQAGADLASTFKSTVSKADLILKVKEPSLEELAYMREGQILFTYLHLAAHPKLERALQKKKMIALAYETVQLPDGSLPLLKPMSVIAGRLAGQIGAHYLRRDQGGVGKLYGGVEGASPAIVTILGSGNVGLSSAAVAHGMGAHVVMMDINQKRLQSLKNNYSERFEVALSTPESLAEFVPQTDVLIGAVLIAGQKTPKLVSKNLVGQMKPGSVIIDVAVDQGGCVETSRPTTHEKPIFTLKGVLHYGVTNMPGCVPHTATASLVHATLPYVLDLANLGIEKAFQKNQALKAGCVSGRSSLT